MTALTAGIELYAGANVVLPLLEGHPLSLSIIDEKPLKSMALVSFTMDLDAKIYHENTMVQLVSSSS